MSVGERIEYYFTSTFPVDFNIHYHEAGAVVMPIAREKSLEDGGVFVAGIPQDYCLMWEAGPAGATLDYRLTSQAGQFGAEPVTFPAQIHDVKGAIRWLRANAAAYGLDPRRFGVWGSSAGGHLAALVATSGGLPLVSPKMSVDRAL